MGHLQNRYEHVSLRSLCEMLSIRRSTIYQVRKGKRQVEGSNGRYSDDAIMRMIQKVRAEQQTWGFRLIYHYLKKVKGIKLGKTRAYGLYRAANMSLHRTPKKPRIKRAYQELLAPKNINEGWAMDFMSEWVIGEKQQSVRIINVVDECSRKDLWIEAAQSINADKLIEVLNRIVEMRGLPRYIRCDNGPEFISEKLKAWAKDRVEIKFIQPGKPTQNGIIERLNGTVRRECLNLNWFNSLEEINDLLGKWFKTYNFDRPHISLKYTTPHQFETKNQNLYFSMVAQNEG